MNSDLQLLPEGFAARAAERVHAALFARGPSSLTAKRFAAGLDSLCASAPAREVELLVRAIDRAPALGALETAARYAGTLPLLVSAFHLMVYVVEAEPGSQRWFVKQTRDVPGAFWSLISGAVQTGFHLVVGLPLLVWVRHA
jgi:hypothetical protein